MAIPEQIRKQSEAITKLYEDLNQTDEGNAPAEGEGAQPTQADNGSGGATGPESAEQGRPGTPKEEQTTEQRYRTLQGMYNADTTRLRAENAQMGQRVTQLEQLIASLSAPRQPNTAQAAATKLVSESPDLAAKSRRGS